MRIYGRWGHEKPEFQTEYNWVKTHDRRFAESTEVLVERMSAQRHFRNVTILESSPSSYGTVEGCWVDFEFEHNVMRQYLEVETMDELLELLKGLDDIALVYSGGRWELEDLRRFEEY